VGESKGSQLVLRCSGLLVSEGLYHYVLPSFRKPISFLFFFVPAPLFLTQVNMKGAWQFHGPFGLIGTQYGLCFLKVQFGLFP